MNFFLTAVLCLAAAVAPSAALAQTSSHVRVVVPAPPGGSLDAGARLLAQKLSVLTGEPYVVDNRPGGGTQIGTEAVIRAPADGRTILFHGTSLVFLPLLQKTHLSPLTDLAPVAQVSVDQYVLVASTAGSITSASELTQLASRKPAGINCAAYPGVSTVSCEQLKAQLGARSETIPYVGVAPGVNAVLGGHADIMFVNLEPVQKLVQAGKLRVLAQTRGAGFTVPVISDVWPGFLIEGHTGVLVPAGTPEARIQQLNRDINRVLADPEVIAQMREGGLEPAGGPPQRYAETMKRTYQRYAEIIQRLDIGPK